MIQKFLICVFYSIVLPSVKNAVAQAPPPENIRRIDTFLNRLNADRNINGNVLIAEKGNILYENSYGFADALNHLPNEIDTKFVMASVSKPFTATAILQLIENGKLALDEKVQKYLQAFPFKQITVRHLLSHTSGLPNTEELFSPLLPADMPKVFSNSDIIPALELYGKSLHFEPGGQFEYCNTNYSLLALLVEKTSGLSFAHYMNKYVFQPSCMMQTEILSPGFNLGAGYGHKYDRPVHYLDTLRPIERVVQLRKFTYNWVGFQGPGNMASTMRDMLAFDQALYNGKLLKQESIDLMFTPNRLNDGSISYRRSGIDEAAYGLGWYIFKNTDNGKVVWHSGGVPGMNSFMMRNIDTQQFIIVADNAQNAPVAPELYLLLSGRTFNRPRSLARLYIKSLVEKGADYAAAQLGTYRNTDEFALNEGELNLLGIELLDNHQLELALEAFRTNTLLFPTSFNVFDSHGEALMKAGKKEAAILMYRHSVTLNPNNEGGKKMLEKLLK